MAVCKPVLNDRLSLSLGASECIYMYTAERLIAVQVYRGVQVLYREIPGEREEESIAALTGPSSSPLFPQRAAAAASFSSIRRRVSLLYT